MKSLITTYTHDRELGICKKQPNFCEERIDNIQYYLYDEDFELLEIVVIDKGKSFKNKFKYY